MYTNWGACNLNSFLQLPVYHTGCFPLLLEQLAFLPQIYFFFSFGLKKLLRWAGFIKHTWQITAALCLICKHPSEVPGFCCWQYCAHTHPRSKNITFLAFMLMVVLVASLLPKCWPISERKKRKKQNEVSAKLLNAAVRYFYVKF